MHYISLNNRRRCNKTSFASNKPQLQRNWINPEFLKTALLISLAIFLNLSDPAIAAYSKHTDPVESISQLSKATLERKIEAVEIDTDLSMEDISKLVSLYRKTISNLETASANDQAADAFIQINQGAPVKAAVLRKKTIAKKKMLPENSLEIASNTPIEALEQHLLKEKADLAAVEANLQKTHESIKYLTGRPKTIRLQLIDTKKTGQRYLR